MSPKLKRMSGSDIVSVFCSLGFEVVSQKGSHIKLRRLAIENEKQTLTIPNHKEIDAGTLNAIIRQASRYIDSSKLKELFYIY